MPKNLNKLRQHVAKGLEAMLEEDEHTLRPRQVERVAAILEDLQAGNTCGHIQSPTGTGKTVMFGQMIEAIGLKALVLAPTKNLVDQTKKDLVKTVGYSDEAIGVYHSGVRAGERAKALECDVLVTTYM